MLTFKHGPFIIHPLVHRPNLSSTYLCIFQNMRRWVGPSLISYHCITISILLSLTHLGMYLKSWTFKHQTTKVVTFAPLNNVLHSIYNTSKVKFKRVFKTCIKCTSRFNHNSTMLCIPHHYTYNIFERRWYTKPKNGIKVAKDLPHMCPWHQPNKEKVSNIHKVNNNKPPIIIYVT